ncbi:MAG TPA: cell envelope integrity protein CreD [Phnomibacter sp.]|nr:cell envelope integrity protein CreD [Phnomibacter sp.]
MTHKNSTTTWNLTLKGIITAGLIIAMLIPAVLVQELIEERKARQHEVINEVSDKWARSQTLTGPFITVPYTYEEKRSDGNVFAEERLLTILPETLHVAGEMTPHFKRRSIFEVALYKSDLELTGNFLLDKKVAGAGETMHWERARLCIGVSDIRGIEKQPTGTLADRPLEFESGIATSAFEGVRGASAPADLSRIEGPTTLAFSIPLQLKGSEMFKMLPLGKTTTADISSAWTSPSFTGNFLPEYELNEKGFSAQWNVLHFNRDFPQVWKHTTYKADDFSFGLSLLQPADSYAKTLRTAKYAILFIGLTFGFFYLLEIILGHRVHPVQYVLTGLALVVFYTLLLSISEVSSFNVAYPLSAMATIMLITTYSRHLFGAWKNALMIGAFLTALYGYIFILLQLEDSALLAGSIGLFVLVAIAMHLSRKIDWYPPADKDDRSIAEAIKNI